MALAFGGLLVRPDGFYPTNGMMTTFVILMVIFQGIDWLGQRRMVRGLAAFLLPWPGPSWPPGCWRRSPPWPPRWASPATPSLPIWGVTGDSSWPVLAMGLVLYLFRRNRRGRYWPSPCSTSSTGWCIWASWPPQMPDFAWTQLFTRYYEIYGILAAPLMLCYNGQRGGGHKRLFYAFYPAHIYILYALSWGLYLLLN